ncbi:MAG TPA: hypothetical protein VL393_01190, partial [Candidatus Binataceae bacterium]|nr:hypothetical protein [Candidatus Binataceae bacterium]
RRGDRTFDVLGAGVGYLGEFAFGRRLDIRKARAAGRRNVPIFDEQVGFHVGCETQLNFLDFRPQDNSDRDSP